MPRDCQSCLHFLFAVIPRFLAGISQIVILNHSTPLSFENFPIWEFSLILFQDRLGWKARYVKEVDANEVTVRFYQETFDEMEKLIEVHHKYPIDQGHKKVEG